MTAESTQYEHILITGMSGVGKTAVINELRRRGHTCIDMDESGWSYMDCDGHQHWNVQRLEKALSEAANARIFVSGCAEEQAALYDSFSAIILLSAPSDVMVSRLQSRPGKSHGQNPTEMTLIMADLEAIEPLLRARCTHEIQTTIPVAEVADRILEFTCPTRRCSRCADARH
jgi:broad-specificity NMP kinase